MNGNENYSMNIMKKCDVDDAENKIIQLLNIIRDYKPMIGPFIEFQESNPKAIIRNLLRHVG